jgi:hypothetical protein
MTPVKLPKCHVHDTCNNNERQSIHKYVCRKLKTTQHIDGNYYCLLHLPTKTKNNASGKSRVKQFESLFRRRLHEAKSKYISYDFRYVWFPSVVSLMRHEFELDTNFSSATFNGAVNFMKATFMCPTNFSSAKFVKSTVFNSAKFKNTVCFKFADFSGSPILFSKTTFIGDVCFCSAKFNRYYPPCFYNIVRGGRLMLPSSKC